MSAFVPESAPQAPVDPADIEPAMSAAERLAASRERMRDWMQDARSGGRHEARRRAAAAADAGESPALLDRLRAAPVVGVVIDAANAWWAHHPLHPAAHLAQGVLRDRVAPLARRHPVAIVLGAFLVGVALVRWRPWRLLAKSALFAGLGSQIIARLVSSVPLDSVLDAFGPRGSKAPGEADGAGEPPPPGAASPPAGSASPSGGTAPAPAGTVPPAGTAPAGSGPPVPAATAEAQAVTP